MISTGTRTGNQSDFLKVHFGIGDATSIDPFVVEWPDGQIESFQNLEINRNHRIVKSVGLNAPPQSFDLISPPDAGMVDPDQEILRFEWETSDDVDPITYTLSLSGPGVSKSLDENLRE